VRVIYVSNDEESNYADKENVLLCINSCLPTSLLMINRWVEQSPARENKYNKHECIIMIMYVVSL